MTPAGATRRLTRQGAKAVLRRLVAEYGPRRNEPSGDAVSSLVATILSQNTSKTNSLPAFESLRERFADWDAVADAPPRRIAAAIRQAGLSNIKAPRIRKILRQIRNRHGSIRLDVLDGMEDRAAFEYLMAFDGVGPKTAFCVLLFALDRPVFPVDTHILRIAKRLGWLAEGVSAERAHELLTPYIAPGDRYAMHVLLIRHGRHTCHARNPVCEPCPLLDRCPTGQGNLAEKSTR